jgi:hypothetical protein
VKRAKREALARARLDRAHQWAFAVACDLWRGLPVCLAASPDDVYAVAWPLGCRMEQLEHENTVLARKRGKRWPAEPVALAGVALDGRVPEEALARMVPFDVARLRLALVAGTSDIAWDREVA